MLTFNGNLKVYVALQPCDMRKSFNGLSEIARNLIKILYFDGTGYWCVAKRLERGNFSWPQDIEGDRQTLILKPTALAMLTDGIDLREFDYIDVGALIPSSGAVPVVIKSLIFPGSSGQ